MDFIHAKRGLSPLKIMNEPHPYLGKIGQLPLRQVIGSTSCSDKQTKLIFPIGYFLAHEMEIS